MKHWFQAGEDARFKLVREVLFSERLKKERTAAAIYGALALYLVVTIHQYALNDYGTRWFDQRMYYISARAFAAGDLSPALHWYPLLYSLAGAPFSTILPHAPFFFINLCCSVIAAALFLRICSTYEVPPGASAAALLVSLVVPPALIFQFVMPWNTIPVAALTLACLVIVTRPQPLSRRAVLTLAVSASLIALTRPVDALLLLPVGVAAICRLGNRPRLIVEGAAVSAAMFGTYFALHFAIYGMNAPPYIAMSRGIGFDFGRFAEKAYALLVDPEPLYGAGEGLVGRAPWIILAPYGAVLMALRFGWRGAIAPLCATITFVTYIGYSDLTPYSFWRQFNVHYLSGALLIAAICSAVTAVRSFARPLHLAGMMLFTGAIALAGYGADATPASRISVPDAYTIAVMCERCETYDAVEIGGVRIEEKQLYQASITAEEALHRVAIGGRVERNIHDFRTIPQRDGVRIVFDRPRRERSMIVRFARPHGLNQHPSARFIDGRFRLRI